MRNTWLVFTQAVTVALAVLFVLTTLKPQWWQHGLRIGAPAPVVVPLGAGPAASVPAALAGGAVTSYREAARRAAPAVVSITASRAPAARAHGDGSEALLPFLFGERAPRRPRAEPQVGLGSGVIVSPEGYLLTNNHVVDGADDIEVALNDGRQVRARLVGTDPETDVAVLKIELDRLPSIRFGDVADLQVGDVVLAIGNPFDVGQTVTSGIVSALGRNRLGINTFENFIQTDAAINPGNSGGALVDAAGNLLGINTAIYSNSRSGGSLGIGFAIPVTTARQVMEALIRDGQVTRGYLGIEQRDLTADLARTLSLPIREGVLITGVVQTGPAAAGGVRPGDVVTGVGELPVTSTFQLLNAVAALKPKSLAALHLQRGSQALTLDVTVGQRPRSRPATPLPGR